MSKQVKLVLKEVSTMIDRNIRNSPAAHFVDTEIRGLWSWRIDITRRAFSRGFKQEAVELIVTLGVGMAQTLRDLRIHANVLSPVGAGI